MRTHTLYSKTRWRTQTCGVNYATSSAFSLNTSIQRIRVCLTAEYPATWVNLFLHMSRSLKICAQVESGTIVAGYCAVAPKNYKSFFSSACAWVDACDVVKIRISISMVNVMLTAVLFLCSAVTPCTCWWRSVISWLQLSSLARLFRSLANSLETASFLWRGSLTSL